MRLTEFTATGEAFGTGVEFAVDGTLVVGTGTEKECVVAAACEPDGEEADGLQAASTGKAALHITNPAIFIPEFACRPALTLAITLAAFDWLQVDSRGLIRSRGFAL